MSGRRRSAAVVRNHSRNGRAGLPPSWDPGGTSRCTDDNPASIDRAVQDVMTEPAGRQSAERKLTLARTLAESPHDPAGAATAEALETIIGGLIPGELLLSLLR